MLFCKDNDFYTKAQEKRGDFLQEFYFLTYMNIQNIRKDKKIAAIHCHHGQRQSITSMNQPCGIRVLRLLIHILDTEIELIRFVIAGIKVFWHIKLSALRVVETGVRINLLHKFRPDRQSSGRSLS